MMEVTGFDNTDGVVNQRKRAVNAITALSHPGAP